MVHIRDMTADDAPEVAGLYADSWARTYGDLLSAATLGREIRKRFSPELQTAEVANPDIIAMVAIEDGEIVGAASAQMDNRNQAWIDRMHLLPGKFGSGLADDLLRALLAKHTGLQTIMLKVLKGNDRAVRFYEKHGFVVTDEVPSDDKVGGAPAMIMTRTIPRG